MIYKVCNDCKVNKPISDFYKNTHGYGLYGVLTKCKICVVKKQRHTKLSKREIPKIENLPSEVWVDILGYVGLYQVSNFGRVKVVGKKNFFFPSLLKQTLNSSGYYVVRLYNKSKFKDYPIHRLVAVSFISNPDKKPTVNHKNGIKIDNRVDNLEWATNKEQSAHAIKTGLVKKKRRYYGVKLKPKDVNEIRIFYAENNTIISIANKFSVGRQTIRKVVKFMSWKKI